MFNGADIGEVGGITLNRDLQEQLVENLILSRQKFFDMFMDRKRDIGQECGYPEANAMSVEEYKKLYDRDPLSHRVVTLYPSECWQVAPDVYEQEDLEQTDFELAFEQLGRQIAEIGNFQTEQGNPIWEYLERADSLSGIGRYGVILLGFDDGGALSDPLPLQEISVEISEQKEEKERPDGSKYEQKTLNYAIKPKVGEKPSTEQKRQLLYIRVLDESMAPITRWDNDPTSKRFGKPEEYTITVSGPSTETSDGRGVKMTDSKTTHRVHWSRVIHIADNLETSEVLGKSRLQVPYNRLYDLHKLLGGSAEMYWRAAFMGLALETHPQLGGQVKLDVNKARQQISNYQRGLDRYLAIPGLTVKSIAPQVADVSNHVEVQIDSLCIFLACPKRIFMGSERGELASSQDARSWYGVRLPKRHNRYLTPRVIVPTIIRLIQVGALPMPKQFCCAWPDVMSVTALEQADIAGKRTEALSKYVAGDVNAIMTPKDFLVRELKYSEEEASQILQNKINEEEDEDYLDIHEREDQMAEEEAARAAEQGAMDADFRQQEIDIVAKTAATKTPPTFKK